MSRLFAVVVLRSWSRMGQSASPWSSAKCWPIYMLGVYIAFEQRGILIVPHLYCNMQSLGLLSWPELKVFWSSVVRILVFSIPTKLGTKHLWTKEIQVCLMKGHALLKNEKVKIPWRLRISFSRTTVPTFHLEIKDIVKIYNHYYVERFFFLLTDILVKLYRVYR